MTSVFTNPLPAQEVEKLGAGHPSCRRRARHGGARRSREGRRDARRRARRPSRRLRQMGAGTGRAHARTGGRSAPRGREEVPQRRRDGAKADRSRDRPAEDRRREPRGLRHHEPRDGALQSPARRDAERQAAGSAGRADVAPVPARLHPAQSRRARRPDPPRPADRRSPVLPDRRRQDRGLSRPRRLRHRAAPAQQSGSRRRGPLGRDALHVAPPDARPAPARGGSRLRARTRAKGAAGTARDWPIEIGLWVGGAATPNNLGSAKNRKENTAVFWLEHAPQGPRAGARAAEELPVVRNRASRRTAFTFIRRRRRRSGSTFAATRSIARSPARTGCRSSSSTRRSIAACRRS